MGVQRRRAQPPLLRRGCAQSRLRRADLLFVPRATTAGGAPRPRSTGGTLLTMAERSTEAHDYLSKPWLASHLSEERREADLLSEVREAIFGAQDGVTSILTVVITVATATSNQYAVLVAGMAAAIAEVISMGAGEYMSSKSQREIFLAQIEKERQEVSERPHESEAEVAYMLEQEGLPEPSARHAAAELARPPHGLLNTMGEKEHVRRPGERRPRGP